jgi:hypothetical protein
MPMDLGKVKCPRFSSAVVRENRIKSVNSMLKLWSTMMLLPVTSAYQALKSMTLVRN